MRIVPNPLLTVAAVVALLLSACGGGDGSSLVSGTVRDHNQAAVANAAVLAVDRLTGREFNTTSDEYGRYHFSLPNGHYDWGSDDGQQKAAHMVTLRTLSDSDTTVDFALPADQEAAQISGQVFIREGVPAAYYRLVFSSHQEIDSTDDDPNLSEETTTDDQGRFTLPLAEPRLMDVDIYDANDQFVEFVVLQKLQGGLRADITLGDASDDNRYRHDQGPNTLGSSQVAPAALEDGALFQLVLESARKNIGHDIARMISGFRYVIQGGALAPNGQYLALDGTLPVERYDSSLDQVISTPGPEANIDALIQSTLVVRQAHPPILDVSVREDGRLWFYHAIHLNVGPSAGGIYEFTDESGENYYKSAHEAGYYKLSYNSDQPRIVKLVLPLFFAAANQ